MKLTLVFILAATLACNVSQDKTAASVDTSEKISDTEKAINQTMEGAYDFWKYKEGSEADFTNFHDFYTPNSVIQTMRGDSLEIEYMKEGLKGFEEAINAGKLTYFREYEIDSETEIFGNIAHRISYHAYQINSVDSVSRRAVNSIQLVNIDGNWLLHSVLRQFEDDEFPFPSKYDNINR